MKLKVGVAFALAVVALAGCASSGVKVEERQLANFERGKTTYGQVVAQLGPPNGTTLMSDGRRVIVYSYVQAQARPESFIPIVGLFVGGADARSNTVSMVFTQDGVLESSSASESQVGVGTGFASSSTYQGRTDQPRVAPDPPRPQSTALTQAQPSSASPAAGKVCTHEELVQARIARMNGYTNGPKCANTQ